MKRLCLVAFAILPCLLHATTYCVTMGGNDNNDGLSWKTAFATPKRALAVAADGDKVVVGDGTWTNVGKCDMVVTNAIEFTSLNGPGATIFDGGAATSVGADYIYNNQTGTESKYRWVVEVRNANAVVHGFTLQGGFRYNPSVTSASGLQLFAGTVSNCIVRLCRGGGSGGGAYVSGGLLKGCEIYGNVVRYNNNTTCSGGGVFQVGGTVDSCVITNNSAGNSGSGVFIRGGTLRDSLLADNHGHYSDAQTLNTTGGSGGGLCLQEGGCLVENCIIRDNVRGLKSAAGVYVNHNSAILRNCLVVGNAAQSEVGGVLLAKGRVENCTIFGNGAAINGTTGTGLRQTGGTVVNSIVYGNPTSGGASDVVKTSGTFETNLVSKALDFFSSGDGNVVGNPTFADAANGDFTLLFGSPAIDAGQTVAAVAGDIAGNSRPQGAAYDIGAYEYTDDGSFAVAFPTTPYTFLDDGSATLVASVSGTPGGETYEWFVDGVRLEGETGAAVTLSGLGYGRHAVKVVARRGGDEAAFEIADLVTVVPDTVYVSQSGSATFPYDTSAKATASIKDAVAAVYATDEHQGRVVVAPSDATGYLVDAFVIPVVKNVIIESTDGPEATLIKCTNPVNNDGRRAFELRHAGAVVSGFTIYNGSWYDLVLGDSGSGALQIYDGTVSNCVLRGIRGCRNGGAARLYGGLLTHCVVTNCYSRYNNDNSANGGGIYMAGGTVAYSLVRDCRAGDNETGAGIYIMGGVVRDSEISGCYLLPQASGSAKSGGGIFMSGGLVERCVITNNCPAAKNKFVGLGGGVYVKGGTLRNCLVAGNRASVSGAGVYQTGGTVEFCTVTANTGTGGSASGLFLNGAKASCRYNILDGNGAGVNSEPNCNIAYTTAASFATNLVVTDGTTYGADNIYAAAGFTDAANRDWTLGAGSPAIDAAVGVDGVTDDLNGDARPTDGNGDGVAWPDLGCYEAPDASAGPLRCSFSPDAVTGLGSATAVFTASASGSGADGELTYTWDFGAGATATSVGGNPAIQSVTFSGYGSRTVTLTVETPSGATATATVVDCVKVGSAAIFVDATNENPVWPYATWATAATNVQDVFDSLITDGTTSLSVTVANGSYTITEPYIVISYPIRIESLEGPDVTTIRAASSSTDARGHFRINHADVLVSGFTFSDAQIDTWNTGDYGASSLRITAGVVSNCVVSSAVTARSNGAVGVSGTGLLTHSVLRNCYTHRSTSSGSVVYGGGVTVGGGGVVQFCSITGCHTHGANGSGGGGAYVMEGGVLRDCEILDCYGYGTPNGTVIGHGGSVRQAGGLVERCIIGDTVTEKRGGEAVRITGGTMRSCLVRGAVAGSEAQALYVDGGTVENCTVVTNGYGTALASSVAAVIAGGGVTNAVFFANNGGDVTLSGGTIAFSRFAEAAGSDGNISADPVLVMTGGSSKPIYSLANDSPCCNAGFRLPWSDDATDLAGNPRRVGRTVDMGCYESPLAIGLQLFVR